MILPACTETETLETIDEISIQAYLFAGQPLTGIKIGRVIPLDSTQAEAAPTDLEPVVRDEAGNRYVLTYQADDTTYAHEALVIESGQRYWLELAYQDKLITAETFVPAATDSIEISDTSIGRVQVNDFADLQNQTRPDPVEVSWTEVGDAYYFVSVSNTESDPTPIVTLFDEGEGPRRFVDQTEPSTETFYVLNAFQDITHYGNHKVEVFTVNPEYVALYEDNSSGAGSINEIRTNIVNGFGIFTGVNSQVVGFKVVEE